MIERLEEQIRQRCALLRELSRQLEDTGAAIDRAIREDRFS